MEIVIRHIMADGTVRDSVDGYKVAVNENTEHIYSILAGLLTGGTSKGRDI
jgi:hypothetical protein